MSEPIDAIQLGWSESFETAFQDALGDVPDGVPARIVREDRGIYRAIYDGAEYSAEVTGSFRNAHTHSEEFPAVGDWVVAVPVGDEEKLRIHSVLPRKTVFKRTAVGVTSETQVVAANIDTVFIVMGLDGDFNPRRAERYIALAYESGAQPVVVLSKSDVASDLDEQIIQVENVAIGVSVHPVSSLHDEGLEYLSEYLGIGKTIALLGSSGAGKSTLVNALTGNQTMDTGEVREDDSRGRHTTTHRQLVVLPTGGLLIDTPGMREIQLTGDDESLANTFGDVEALFEQCRFRDCSHDQEPGCAVQGAIESGALDIKRYNSYLKLKRELAYVQRRQSESYAQEERQRGRDFNKMVKRIHADREKLGYKPKP
jgi:ribosome biogenesis GTPase